SLNFFCASSEGNNTCSSLIDSHLSIELSPFFTTVFVTKLPGTGEDCASSRNKAIITGTFSNPSTPLISFSTSAAISLPAASIPFQKCLHKKVPFPLYQSDKLILRQSQLISQQDLLCCHFVLNSF